VARREANFLKSEIKRLGVIAVAVCALTGAAFAVGMASASNSPVQVASADGTVPATVPASPARAALPPSHPPLPPMPEGSAPPGEPRFAHFRVGNKNVKAMLADGDIVWVGTSGGVIRYDTKSDDYKLFDVSSGSLLSNGVFHLSKLDNKIVAGTYGGGMSVFDPATEKWRNYNIPDGLADQFVYDVQKVANGDVWIATWSGANRIKGGKIDDPTQWETYNPKNTHGGLPNEWVYGLEEGKNGDMWFATENGLARYKDGKWQNWQHDAGLGAPYDLVKDDSKFTTDPGGASRHHAQQKAEQGLQNVNIAYNPNYVVSLKVDRDGIVWAGTWGAGLARFDGQKWRNFTVKDGLPSNHIFMLSMDPQGRIWAGTSHGLVRVDNGGEHFVVLTRNEGLYSDNVFSMATASDGSSWIGSFGGVARLFGKL